MKCHGVVIFVKILLFIFREISGINKHPGRRKKNESNRDFYVLCVVLTLCWGFSCFPKINGTAAPIYGSQEVPLIPNRQELYHPMSNTSISDGKIKESTDPSNSTVSPKRQMPCQSTPADTVPIQLIATPIFNDEKRMRLNISWSFAEGAKRPCNFSIEIVSENHQPCKKPYIAGNESWALVPQYITHNHDDHCIAPKYKLNITIMSNSEPKRKIKKKTIQFTVPQCIKGICLCEDNSTLPLIKVKAVLSSNKKNVTISWDVINNYDSCFTPMHFVVRFYSNSSSRNYLVNEKINFSESGQRSRTYGVNIETGKFYDACVYLVDTTTDPSRAGYFYIRDDFLVSIPKSLYMEYWVIPVALSAAVLLMAGIVHLYTTRCRMKGIFGERVFSGPTDNLDLHKQPAWLPNHRPTTENSRSGLAHDRKYSNETSPLYIPKDFAGIRGRNEKREKDRWEISQERVRLGEKVGEGAFGYVYIAEVDIKGHPVVAVKKLKDFPAEDEISEFLSEIEMLKKVGCHPNVVELVGCCTVEKPYYALLEYAPRGDLLKHLRSLREYFRSHQNRKNSLSISSDIDSEIFYLGNRPKTPPAVRPSESGTDYTFLGNDDRASLNYITGSIAENMFAASVTPASASSFATDIELTYPMTNRTDMSGNSSAFVDSIPPVEANEYCQAPSVQGLDPKVLHMYALQIARGMEHLEKKQITHRDLAARNVLIDEKGNLKVSDLGLSRTGVYVLSSRHRKVPLRWLSIEAIEMSRYSNKSDVWAYAVLLWEIGTLGAFPYPAVQDYDIPKYLMAGQRLDQPKTISDEIYQTMKSCWSNKPALRPDFSDLVKLLEEDETKTKSYKDIYTLKEFKFLPMESIHEIAREAV